MRRPTLRIRWPAPTIRLRMTVLYGVVFLVTGAILLTLGYLLVRHNLDRPGNIRQAFVRRGVSPFVGPPFFGRPLKFNPGSPEARVAFAVRAQLQSAALHRLLIEYLIALGVMTAVSVGAGWLLAGRALRPLRRITGTARRVSGQNLGERIALTGPADELKELADTFDGMLGRLDTAFASQRHFVANASHELRTPLAIMRAELDVALVDPDAGEPELRRMAEAVRETVDRCERLLEGLLMLARSEAAIGREEPVDLGALAADCITDLSAPARELDLEFRDQLWPAWTLGEPALLERMLANLLGNAIRYNRHDGFIEVATGQRGDQTWLTVSNGGEPIDPAEAQLLTEPFRRLERSPGGFGLGLSIVRSVVEAHHGRLTITARSEGGLEVTVELPGSASGAAPTVLKKTPRALTKS
jgi:signal transduction histidine kinase